MNRFLHLLLQVGLSGLLILAHQNAQANNSVDGAVSARHLRSNNKVAASPHSLARNLKNKKDNNNNKNEGNKGNTRDEAALPPEAAPRIVGGEEVDDLQKYMYFAHLNGCGGSKISKRCILTAAHCVGNKSPRTATFGKLDKYEDGTEVKIKDWIPHPLYNSAKTDYDFAIICAKDDIKMKNGKEIKSIEIDDGSNSQAGREAFALGFGWTNYDEKTSSDSLRIVDLTIKTEQECERKMGSSSITPRMICASKPNKDACVGDSGGPLVDKDSGKLVGLTSWGINCAKSQFEGVYSRVSYVKDWIDSTIEDNGGFDGGEKPDGDGKPDGDENNDGGGNTTGDVTKFNSCHQAYEKIIKFGDCTRDLFDREKKENNDCESNNSNCEKVLKKKFKKVCRKCDKSYAKCESECDKQGFCDS